MKHSPKLKREINLFYQRAYIKGALFDGYIQTQKRSMITLMFNLHWIFITKIPSKFSTIIYDANIVEENFAEYKCLTLILSKEISDAQIVKQNFHEIVQGRFPLVYQLTLSLSYFQP